MPGERRTSLERARRQVSFPILVPAVLGQPGQVVVSDGGRVVSLIYLGTPYGQVRMDEFAGQVDQIYFEKIVYLGNVTKVKVVHVGHRRSTSRFHAGTGTSATPVPAWQGQSGHESNPG